MIFETLALSFLIGKFRGGKLRNLEELYINGWYFLVTSFVIEILSLLLIIRTNGKIADFLYYNFSRIHIITYSLLLLGLVLNIKEKGFLIAASGALFNFFALIFNNGKMPVSPGGLKVAKLFNQLALLAEDAILTHSLINSKTKLSFLCDIIPVPKPYPFPKVISIGDIILAIGLFVLIQKYMTLKADNK